MTVISHIERCPRGVQVSVVASAAAERTVSDLFCQSTQLAVDITVITAESPIFPRVLCSLCQAGTCPALPQLPAA